MAMASAAAQWLSPFSASLARSPAWRLSCRGCGLGFLCFVALPPPLLLAHACVSPARYSHRISGALAWLGPSLRSLSSARWSKARSRPSASLQLSDWLHLRHHSRPRILSIASVERPRFKSHESPRVLASFATRALKHGDSLLDLPLDSCLSDAVASEVVSSLQEAPLESQG